MKLKMRDIDIDNTEKLSKMENITIIESPDDLYRIIGISKE
jgi:flavoprotein